MENKIQLEELFYGTIRRKRERRGGQWKRRKHKGNNRRVKSKKKSGIRREGNLWCYTHIKIRKGHWGEWYSDESMEIWRRWFV